MPAPSKDRTSLFRKGQVLAMFYFLPVFQESHLKQTLLVLKLDHMKHTAEYIRGEIEPPIFM